MRSPFRVRHARAALCTLGLAAAGCSEPYGAPVRVVVPPGASFSAATDSLARAGIVGQPAIFRLYAKVTRNDRALKPGTYMLRRGSSWPDLLEALTEGKGLVHALTIPEGYSLSWIVPRLTQVLGAPAESVQAAVRDTTLRRELDVPTGTLEGYLFPDTYAFPDGTTPRAAVRMMVERFEREWKPEWTARLDTLTMSRHDVVTLASIVDKEAKLPEERAVIAAVYHNRLKKGMLLQADPTVQYARGQHTNRVLYRDLAIASPYNTYRHPGLPPGPIGSPGAASIEATLYPADVPYLFFVAHPDGHHEFRATFAEHSAAVAQMRRARDAATRAKGDSAATAAAGTGRAPAGTKAAPATKTAPRRAPATKRANPLATPVRRRRRCRAARRARRAGTRGGRPPARARTRHGRGCARSAAARRARESRPCRASARRPRGTRARQWQGSRMRGRE